VAVTVYPGGREWAALVSAARAGLVLDATAARLGSTPPELDREAGAIWLEVLDDLAARTADACARLTALVGARDGIVVFGGGSASEPWLRAKAAHLGLPLRPGAASAVARGAAVHAGVAAEGWPSADAATRPPPGA
jgi:sugar (pentulose or hexulose) kinase